VVGQRLEHPLAGHDPPLDPRQALVDSDLGALLGFLVAGIAVDDLVIGTRQMGCIVASTIEPPRMTQH
jgi:hypothetical protein